MGEVAEKPTLTPPLEGVRVLFLIDQMVVPNEGGTERQLLYMVKMLQGSGASVQLWVLRETPWLAEEAVGCPVWRAELHRVISLGGIAGLLRLFRKLRREQFSIIQTFFPDSNRWGVIAARLAGVPVVLGSRRNLNWWMGGFDNLLQRFANLFVTRLVANSGEVKSVVAKAEKFPESKIDVIYNGIVTDAPALLSRNQVRDEIGCEAGDVLIGCVANLRPPKGVKTLVQAAAAVLQKIPHARFAVAGEGAERVELEEMIKALGIGPRFHLLGRWEDVPSLLKALDVAVLPSYSEGFSNSLLEYMGAGLPIAATRVGGNAEAVQDAALLVAARDADRLAEAIIKLCNDPVLCRFLGEKARQRVHDNFGLEHMGETLSNYYAGLLRRPAD